MSYTRDKSGGGAGAIAANTRPQRTTPSSIVSRRAARDYQLRNYDLGAVNINDGKTSGARGPRGLLAGGGGQGGKTLPVVVHPNTTNIGLQVGQKIGVIVDPVRPKTPKSPRPAVSPYGVQFDQVKKQNASAGGKIVDPSPTAPTMTVVEPATVYTGGTVSYTSASSGGGGGGAMSETDSPIVHAEETDELAIGPTVAAPAKSKFPYVLVGVGAIALFVLMSQKKKRKGARA